MTRRELPTALEVLVLLATPLLFAMPLVLATPLWAGLDTIEEEIWCKDLTGDHQVDYDDVGVLVARFGACGGCQADFNENGFVGRGDLLILLGNWGDCGVKGDLNDDGGVDVQDLDQVTADLGLQCRIDLDHNGRVAGIDQHLAEMAWFGDPDYHPMADIDESGGLDPTDLLVVVRANGTDCSSDVNHDGSVDSLDVDMICELAGLCPPSG